VAVGTSVKVGMGVKVKVGCGVSVGEIGIGGAGVDDGTAIGFSVGNTGGEDVPQATKHKHEKATRVI